MPNYSESKREELRGGMEPGPIQQHPVTGQWQWAQTVRREVLLNTRSTSVLCEWLNTTQVAGRGCGVFSLEISRSHLDVASCPGCPHWTRGRARRTLRSLTTAAVLWFYEILGLGTEDFQSWRWNHSPCMQQCSRDLSLCLCSLFSLLGHEFHFLKAHLFETKISD